MYKILHHGAVNGVTGSCHQLSVDGYGSVLIDCGLFQGAESFDRETESPDFSKKQIDFDISDVKALFVTHCHIDHVGRIPYLLAAGFSGPIYATKATAALLPLVIEDALKVGVTRNRSIIQSVLARLKNQLVGVEYDEQLDLGQLQVRFQMAGHILGSAYIEFDIEGSDPSIRFATQGDRVNKRVIFSGDLGAPHSPLLPDPVPPKICDDLVIESTYGDRLHEDRKQRRLRLKAIVEKCLKNKGTVLIPAFSIGRTQELLYELEGILTEQDQERFTTEAQRRAEESKSVWDGLDVIVDSPLASKFTQHYRKLKHLWDAEAKQRVAEGRHPLSFENLLTVNSHAEHLKLVGHLKDSGRPAIVIAASGMCAGGRMQNYLKELLPDERSDVIFVGYQAKGTPGRDIQKYGPRFKKGEGLGYVALDNERTDIRAGIYTLGGYSAHADQQDLINFVAGMEQKPEMIRIVHGDDEAKQALKEKYQSLFGCEVVIP